MDYTYEKRLRRMIPVLVALNASAFVAPAQAGETRYAYDNLGRLVRAEQSVPSQPHTMRLTYDQAGNRRDQIVEGSPNGSATAMIVAPLGSGFAVIPIDRQ